MSNDAKKKARELLDKIIPWPWEFYGPAIIGLTFDHESSVGPTQEGIRGPIAVVSGDTDDDSMIAAEFIAAAPELIDSLLKEIRQKDALLDECELYINNVAPNSLYVNTSEETWLHLQKNLQGKLQEREG